jgi:phosphatidylinositol alpha-1,6-mannosyltransferase
VAGRSGGAPEAVASAECGTVVDGRDTDALADALIAWLADPVARGRAAEVGPPLIARTWGAESVAARLQALLDEVVAST